MTQNAYLEKWHDYFGSNDPQKLKDMLADDAVFHSPVVHTPQKGAALVFAYLHAAGSVFGDTNFKYVDEIVDGQKMMLEFTSEIDGIHVNGIDIIHWNDEGKIQDFKVLVRPMKAMNKLWEQMGAMLEKQKA